MAFILPLRAAGSLARSADLTEVDQRQGKTICIFRYREAP
jgi:hypothetical protein